MTPGVTYDTGALIAANKNNREMWRLHATFLALEMIPTVPAPVLAQAWRGGSRQASLARLLKLCNVEMMGEESAKRVGVLAGMANHEDIVAVAVVETALSRGDAIVTSNPTHIAQVLAAAGRELPMKVI